MSTYFCIDVCAKCSSKRTQCPVSKTHAPSLRESFACSDTTEIKYQPIIPMYCSASSACADSAVDSNPMIRCPSCGTTNSTKHPIVPRNFLPACQAVAIGPAANSMHAHVRLAVCQASSVPSAQLRACYRNPICRLSGNPSVGVSSSIILWQKKQESAKHPHTSISISSFNLRFRIIGHRRTLRNHLVRIHISNTLTLAKSRVFFVTGFQIIFRPPLPRRQVTFFTWFLHALLLWAAHT